MQKEAVDPRMVTTPLGATVGWVLAKKIFKDKATTDRQLIGAGLGAGAGYVAGDYLKANPPWQLPTGVQGEDRASLESSLKDRVGNPAIDTNTVKLIDSGYSPVMPDIEPGEASPELINASVRMRSHGASANVYKQLARKEPARAQEYLQTAAEHERARDEAKKYIEGRAHAVKLKEWFRNMTRFGKGS